MASLMTSTQLGSSFFRGSAMPSRATRVSHPRAALTFMPVRASQSLQGVVVSTTGDKTAVVSVDRNVVHPVYKKRVKSSTKYIAHDEAEKCKVGDVVTLAPIRPMSKRKRFAVDNIVNSAP